MDFPIPIKCFTCNLPIAGKWKTFLELVKKYRKQHSKPGRAALDSVAAAHQATPAQVALA